MVSGDLRKVKLNFSTKVSTVVHANLNKDLGGLKLNLKVPHSVCPTLTFSIHQLIFSSTHLTYMLDLLSRSCFPSFKVVTVNLPCCLTIRCHTKIQVVAPKQYNACRLPQHQIEYTFLLGHIKLVCLFSVHGPTQPQFLSNRILKYSAS